MTTAGALAAVSGLEREPGEPLLTTNSALINVCRERLGIESGQIETGGFSFSRRN